MLGVEYTMMYFLLARDLQNVMYWTWFYLGVRNSKVMMMMMTTTTTTTAAAAAAAAATTTTMVVT